MCIDKITALIVAWKGSKICSIGRPLSAVVAVVLMLSFSACADTDTLQIAVVGPLSGKDRAGGRAMLDGVNLRVAEINAGGGVDGKIVEVIVYGSKQ
jgi:branched-chain amino acid transport system substrate-binding protein